MCCPPNELNVVHYRIVLRSKIKEHIFPVSINPLRICVRSFSLPELTDFLTIHGDNYAMWGRQVVCNVSESKQRQNK